MCGIIAVSGSNWNSQELVAALREQQHRGPDNTGYSVFEDGLIGLGHNRLSIIDQSSSANQPLTSDNGEYCLVFNGEIYNYASLREQISDYNFKTSSDSEVLLASYKKWGKDCVTHLQGMFSFIIWDKTKKELYGARDRLGIKPLYYWKTSDKIWFASEIKTFLKVGYRPTINLHVLHDYLNYGYYEHTDETFFYGINQVSQGHSFSCKNIELKFAKYWKLHPTEFNLDWKEDLQTTLLESVALHLISDVQVGLHLTGGLDSSLLASLIREVSGEATEMYAYTGTYGDSSYDEGKYAKVVSKIFGFQHRESKIVSENFWKIAERTQEIQDEPFGGLPTMVYFPMQIDCKKDKTIVLLEGQGGDELFGGYAYYFNAHVKDLIELGKVEEAHSIIALRAKLLDIAPTTLATQILKVGVVHQDGTLILENTCLEEDFAKQFERPVFDAPFTSRFANMRYRDICFTKIPRVLRFNDRMSMAYGHELRVPFLDHTLVEESFKIPPNEFFKLGLGKEPLREVGKRFLPEEFLTATKRSVGSPQREWFRTFLRNDIFDLLSESKLWELGLLKKDAAMLVVEQFLAGKGDNSFQVWQWINLSLWLDKRIYT